jgi:multiple sugar transport system ATP-binding protein
VAGVTFERVGKVYADGTRAVEDLNLPIEEGEFMVLIGPSGCGKTTALRMVAGLEEITEGQIRIGDHVVNTVEPHKRDVAMVFQNYALYPHMSVYNNMAFPLRSQRLSRAETQERVKKIAALLGLEDLLKRKPRTLSGGQRQRVAMGRAIVRQPQVFLMDEPLSNLDAKLRVQVRAEITGLQRTLGVTTVYVTHDQVEAMTMGHRIAVMRKGALQQVGEPQAIYDRPVNLFVASFIGSPAMNLCLGRLEREGGETSCRIGDQTLLLPEAVTGARPALAGYAGRDVGVGVRPEHLIDLTGGDRTMPTLQARVRLVEALGSEKLVHFEFPADPVLADEVLEVARDTDAAAAQTLRREAESRTVVFVARVDTQAAPTLDAAVEIGLEPSSLHFFDLETGRSIYH